MADPLDPRVDIGRVHLKVADLERALAFYCGVLGFTLTQRYGGVSPKGKKCVGMEGLIEEGKEIMTTVEDPSALEAGLIGAAQKVEHYEIAAYGTAGCPCPPAWL